MKLSVAALAKTCALLMGAAVFLTGVANLIWPPYGKAFLDVFASLYPGCVPSGAGDVVLMTAYALADGAISGALLAWLYNRLAP